MDSSFYSDEYQDPLPNFKIPKKKEPTDVKVENYATPLNLGPFETNADNLNVWANYFTAGPDSIPNSSFAPITDLSVFQPVHKEVPKNTTAQKRPFLESCPDLSDNSLPKELTAQFQPLFCKLCSAHLNSNSNALLHYKSKNHEKKVRKCLVEYSERTGEPLHKRAKVKANDNYDDDDPKNKHCDVCDMDFTSKLHADQHYMGRNHHKALINKKPPGHCILGEDGKWHRVKKVENDPTGRNGIGLAFAKPEEFVLNKGKYFCSTCNIYATSQESLDTHYKGQKHLKNVKKLGAVTTTSDPLGLEDAWNPSSEYQPILEAPKVGEWEPITAPQPEKTNLSTCRTPSGNYYCQVCNLSLNSEKQFLQHLESKKHIKNKQSMAAIKSNAH